MADTPFDPDAFLAQRQKEAEAAAAQPPAPTLADKAAAYIPGTQGVSDFLRVGSNSATYGQWDRARAAGEVLTGGAPSYAEALQDKVARSQAARERLGPFMAGTADAVGGLATGATLAKAGGAVVGSAVNAARPLWQRIVGGAVEGGAHGAAQATGHTYSDDPSAYIKPAAAGATMGAILGGGAPAVGAAAGATSKALGFGGSRVSATPGGAPGTVPAELSKAADADRAGLYSMMRGEMGPRAMLPDTGPSMLGTAQGAVPGTSGPGKSALTTNLRTRDESSPAFVSSEVNRLYGPAVTPSRVATGVREQMEGMSPEYRQVLQNARAIDTQGIDNRLVGMLSDAAGHNETTIHGIRRQLEIPTNPGVLDPHPGRIQAVRTAVRERLRDPGEVANHPTLERIERVLTDELQDKVPGIRDLDSRYAELGSQERALQPDSPGSRIFQTDRANVQRPDEFRDTLREAATPKGTATGPSLEPYRLGQAARAEIDRIVGTKKNDLLALEQVLANPQDYNSQKLAIMFGQDRADQLAAVLRNERRGRDTFQKVVEGSQTAARMEAAKAQEASSGSSTNVGQPLWGRFEKLIAGGYDKLMAHQADTTRDRIAQIMATTDPQRLQQIIPQLLASEPDKRARAAIVDQLVSQGFMGAGVGLAASQGGVERKKPLPAGFR